MWKMGVQRKNSQKSLISQVQTQNKLFKTLLKTPSLQALKMQGHMLLHNLWASREKFYFA